ncbi:uncharacterized protein PHALS_08720 [Plasmopara halstedii]|uniref:Uncharacterized protein n=1 Tax=Plasmopara halstedii TaxID=4781 RepID=A0A0P1ADP9_PLAHL|nr:uncharacterized protein PHALS_08720 [Plasmopara halstedii]CEG38660.1 hypothetical protein PHALS_08720 [Plasmopara halstedii]|eukprot:XP_024575029.1 hypothetical protein PHALS_08720 [Plasmopara halstedii]
MATSSFKMGMRSSKPPLPPRVEPKCTDVEIFEEPSAHLHQKSGTVGVPQSAQKEASDDNRAATTVKLKKKRQRIKKEMFIVPPQVVITTDTQSSELTSDKTLLQQSPEVRQQHTEKVQDAYALEKKSPSSHEGRARFLNFESWRTLPKLSANPKDTKTVASSPAMTWVSSSEVLQPVSADRHSNFNDVEEYKPSQDVDDVELLTLTQIQKTEMISTPTLIGAPNINPADSLVKPDRPDFKAPHFVRIKSSEQQHHKQNIMSQSSDLHLDDVDEHPT